VLFVLLQQLIDFEWLEHHYITLELSIAECASAAFCRRDIMQRLLIKSGIKMRAPSESRKGKCQSIEFKHFMSIKRTGISRPPAIQYILRHMNDGKKFSDEYKARLSHIRKGKTHSGINLIGIKNPNWQGGVSFKPYCPKFNEILKDEVRESFDHKCFICHTSQNVRKLDIHHIDYNKNSICNGKKWPLLPLHHRCHIRTNFNRWYWFNLLINYWVFKYDDNMIIHVPDIIGGGS